MEENQMEEEGEEIHAITLNKHYVVRLKELGYNFKVIRVNFL